MDKKNVVVIGGGTGTHTLLRGLKKYKDEIRISAIVTMADSGGSTGRLRDEFGYLPVGDVRMALAALASDNDDHKELLRQLFLYRFSKGDGLSGHNFGNLLLVALTDMLGSEEAAIRAAGRVLRVQGWVLPVTADKIDLLATYDDGMQIRGQHDIDEPPPDRYNRRITKLEVVPKAHISDAAKQAIEAADLLVLGPGDLHTSVLAACVVPGVSDVIKNARGKMAYVCNLMTKVGQTSGLSAKDFVAEIEKYVGRLPDHVLINTGTLPPNLLERYAADHEFPVATDFSCDGCSVHKADLLASEAVVKAKGDVLKRSLIRHDSDKLAAVLVGLL